MTTHPPPMLNTFQLAKYLGKTPTAIRMMRHRGSGPKGIRVGRNVLYNLNDVEAWLYKQPAA